MIELYNYLTSISSIQNETWNKVKELFVETTLRKGEYFKHFDYFCKIFTLQSEKTSLRKYDEKTIEFLYYSVFGMIKELLKREKINSNDKKNKRGFYLHDLIRYTDQLFDCFDKDCSARVAL